MVIRSPKVIIARIRGIEPTIIWGGVNSDTHVGDSEEDLTQKIIDILNS